MPDKNDKLKVWSKPIQKLLLKKYDPACAVVIDTIEKLKELEELEDKEAIIEKLRTLKEESE